MEVFLQEQHSMDPPRMARKEAAQPRYRPVPSSNLQHQNIDSVVSRKSDIRDPVDEVLD